MKDDATTLRALALYLAKFVEEYGKEGHQDRGDPPPERARLRDRLSVVSLDAGAVQQVHRQYLGPTVREQGVTAAIYLGTMSNNDAGKDGTIVTTVNADATAAGTSRATACSGTCSRSCRA